MNEKGFFLRSFFILVLLLFLHDDDDSRNLQHEYHFTGIVTGSLRV
jgi:hypothetical protein